MAGTQRSIEQFIDVEPADAPSSKKGKGRKTVQSEKVVSPPVKRFRCNGKQPEPSLTGTPDAPKHFPDLKAETKDWDTGVQFTFLRQIRQQVSHPTIPSMLKK